MAYTIRQVTFSTNLNGSIQEIVTAFNTMFAGTAIQLLGVDYHRLQSPSGSNDLHLRILYADSDEGLQYEAFLFVSDQFPGGSSAQAKFNAFFAAACYVPLKTVDVTDHELSKTNPDTIIVFAAQTDRAATTGAGLLGHQDSVYIAEADGLIAASGSGAATIYDSNGNVVGTNITITNADSVNAWAAGDRAPVFFDLTSGTFIGIPSCDGTGAVAPDPCPAPVPPPDDCASREVVSVDPRVT